MQKFKRNQPEVEGVQVREFELARDIEGRVKSRLLAHQEFLLSKLAPLHKGSFSSVFDRFCNAEPSDIGLTFVLPEKPSVRQLGRASVFEGEIIFDHIKSANVWLMSLHMVGGETAEGYLHNLMKRGLPFRDFLDRTNNLLVDELAFYDLVNARFHNHPRGDKRYVSLTDCREALGCEMKRALLRPDGVEVYDSNDLTHPNGKDLVWDHQRSEWDWLLEKTKLGKQTEREVKRVTALLHINTTFIPWEDVTGKTLEPAKTKTLDLLYDAKPQRRLRALTMLYNLNLVPAGNFMSNNELLTMLEHHRQTTSQGLRKALDEMIKMTRLSIGAGDQIRPGSTSHQI